ncbi:MAG: hypothetical protein DRI89_15535 [Bacteroidetes bacterium]|nr:MAG: hypothetical protein DRI89_15535 [Bacteroidota bacterium]
MGYEFKVLCLKFKVRPPLPLASPPEGEKWGSAKICKASPILPLGEMSAGQRGSFMSYIFHLFILRS